MISGGTTITGGPLLGGGAHPTIGIPLGTTLGGVGTDIITPFITLVTTMRGIPLTEAITIITPRVRSTVAPQQATAVTDPARSAAHVRLPTADPVRTAIVFPPTAATPLRIATRFPLTATQELPHPQQFLRAERNARSA